MEQANVCHYDLIKIPYCAFLMSILLYIYLLENVNMLFCQCLRNAMVMLGAVTV